MITRSKIRFCFSVLVLALLMFSCRDEVNGPEEPDDRPYDPAKDELVFARKEIRAAWIATVSNLDWPITLSNAEAQKAELIIMLDACKAMNFNAVILQIRPTSDAFYPSQLEPWSYFLTGQQGKDPGYDPLLFAIEESHKRGMEFHAWLNPYRVGLLTIPLASSHVALKNPDWVITYGNNRYFNPGVPAAVDHLKNVIRDIVTRYAVDGIHFDDFFYPYGAKSTSDPFGFNDKAAWEQYGGGKEIHAWREENVNKMVREVSEMIHTLKPGVVFGISPAGKRENSIALYADPITWLNNKWVDYLAPQIYWEYGHPTADFGQVAGYWNSNAMGVPIVIGIAAYKFKDPAYPAYGSTDQIDRQINMVRQSGNLYGCFFFRIGFFFFGELHNFLKAKYATPSILPEMGPVSVPLPGTPRITVSGKQISWEAVGQAVKYGIYSIERDPSKINSCKAILVKITDQVNFAGEPGKTYLVKAVNADNAESPASNVIRIL